MNIELNKIYNIDCLQGFKYLEDKSIDHIFTSPPYNRNYIGFELHDEYVELSEKRILENCQLNLF